MYVTPKQAAQHFKVQRETLRRWAETNKIDYIKTPKGHRRYKINQPNFKVQKTSILYARVSSSKQEDDLQRQILFLQKKFPNYEIITDIASGINFKRKGLKTLLDKVLSGRVNEVVVAHKDRLTRFGFELFQYLCQKYNTKLTILNNDQDKSPSEELADDLLSIVTVFTARYHGARKYKVLQKDSNLSK